jgi:hypothetical protein
MSWAKFDDRFPKHRRIRKLSDAAFRLHVSGICYSSEYLLDGHIAPEDLEDCADIRKPELAAAELVKSGRWHLPGHDCDSQWCYPIDDGWLIHNYLEFNPSREKVEAERTREAERKRRGRARQSGQSPNGVRPDTPRTSDGIPAGIRVASDGPVPSRPVLKPLPTVSDRDNPSPPQAAGPLEEPSGHQGQHPNCRGCGTNQRRLGINPKAASALAEMPPLYCSTCHETYPVRKGADGRYLGCPTCHPEASTA